MNNGNAATRAPAFNGDVLPGAGKALLLAIVLGILPVHSESLQKQAETAAVADGVSTLGGLALGAAEANPLGLAVFPLKALYMSHIKTMPEDEQADAYAGLQATSSGAAANNLCIIGAILTGGGLAPFCPIIGVAWAMNELSKSAQERELWAICRAERAYWKNPAMTCDFFNKPPL